MTVTATSLTNEHQDLSDTVYQTGSMIYTFHNTVHILIFSSIFPRFLL